MATQIFNVIPDPNGRLPGIRKIWDDARNERGLGPLSDADWINKQKAAILIAGSLGVRAPEQQLDCLEKAVTNVSELKHT